MKGNNHVKRNISVLCILLGAFFTSSVRPQPSQPIQGKPPVKVPGKPPFKPHVNEGFVSQKVYTTSEMKELWGKHTADGGFSALFKEVRAKGFEPIETSRWGYEGTVKDKDGKIVDVQFCVYDFSSPSAIKAKTWQTGSLIWGRVGKKAYKAYLVLPKRATDLSRALEASQEWFADSDGKVQRAHSWGKRFGKCIKGGKHDVNVETFGTTIQVTANCQNSCLAAIAVCGGAAAILELASGGLGTPVLIAVFAGCAAAGCGQCLALCALAAL